MGATAPWLDPDEATKNHIIHSIAWKLAERLQNRIDKLKSSDLTMGDVIDEMRRQMAECAVDGNVLLARDISAEIEELLIWRDEEGK